MLSLTDVIERAYVFEHLVHFVKSVANLKADLVYDKYLVYRGPDSALIVGYPVSGTFSEYEVKEVAERLLMECARVVVVAPKLPKDLNFTNVREDTYYVLELPVRLRKKVRYMIGRAGRELEVIVERRLVKDHKRLIKKFLKRKAQELSEDVKVVFESLDRYVKSSDDVYVLSAYNRRGDLVGFDVVDLSSKSYAFYMFNFIDRDEDKYVPGTSDLLMSKIVELALSIGRRFVNMGLGVNEGVKRFKIKWGAREFLPYACGECYSRSILRLMGLLHDRLG